RAMTEPIAVEKMRRQTNPFGIQIPNPVQRPAGKPRAQTMLGIPTIPKVPGKRDVVQIPVIAPRGTRPAIVPAVPPHAALAADAVPDPVAESGQDTTRDEFPFALRNELRMLEQRASTAPPVDVDYGWESEPAHAARAQEAVPAPVLSQ